MNFKNWFQLNEGVDVGIAKYTPKDIPEDLGELSHHLMNTLHYQYKMPIDFEQITPDGDDFFKNKGLLNFYVGGMNGTGKSRDVKKLVQKSIEYLTQQGIKTGKPIVNTWQDAFDRDSKRYGNPENLKADYSEKARGNLNAVRVIRLPVELDLQKIKEADKAPSVSMGFDTAKAVFEGIYGLPSAGQSPMGNVMAAMQGQSEPQGEWNGYEFSAKHIIDTFENIKKSGDIDMWAGLEQTPDSVSKEKGKATIFSQGIDKERIMRQAENVYNLAKWAFRNGYNNMYAM
jgi:hypothetical protein